MHLLMEGWLKNVLQHNTLSKNNSLTHTHLVARRRATTRSFHSLLSAISAAISLASKKKKIVENDD